MPKTPIDYSKSVIYKICCKDPNVKEIYIGSTTNFTKRKYAHKSGVNKICDKNDFKLYNFIRENGGWDNWDMVMIKQYSNCKNKLKLHKKERKYIEKYNATLNGSIPFTTINETRQKYIINNPEKIKQSKQDYRDTHRQRINEKHNCECGGVYSRSNKARHQKSKKHQNFINAN